MEFECKNMTAFGCERMDSVKKLQLVEMVESWYFDTDTLCKNQCCKDCDNKCSYECGRVRYLDPVEEFKKVEYTQLSFF